ncbi:hypothetical protein [Nitrospira defluvii]|uniref:Uncharacterized protein n=1 Tax=Nitrospira defluvii TaxID=330214 RepID=A0ABN7LEV1_9BACT|nr:hypothetical protein [Nitrospira defluvii]CAE6740424.1 conserved hypothetical protein [Nitrospira defluvii]
MTPEQWVIAMLLVLALLVEFIRRLKGTVEEAHGDEAEVVSIPVAMKKRIPIRALRGPIELPRVVRPAMEADPAARRERPRITANARAMRRGIVFMAVLGPCRGLEPPDCSNRIG